MNEGLSWDHESSEYIASRSGRYPDAVDIDIAWTQEVLADVDMVALEPDPSPGWAPQGSSDARPPQDASWS